jgi:hypothetical protein
MGKRKRSKKSSPVTDFKVAVCTELPPTPWICWSIEAVLDVFRRRKLGGNGKSDTEDTHMIFSYLKNARILPPLLPANILALMAIDHRKVAGEISLTACLKPAGLLCRTRV